MFCLRRFYIVLVNTAFNAECPFTQFKQSRYFYKIILFLLIQSVYLLYVESTRPHAMTVFNRLEVFNESALMLLAYVMIAFSGIVEGKATGNSLADLLAFGVTVLILIGNFGVLVSRNIWKVKLILKKRGLKKQAKLRRDARPRIFKTNRVAPEPNDTIPGDRTDRQLINHFSPDRTTPGTWSSRHLREEDLDDAFKIELHPEHRPTFDAQVAGKLD